MDIQALKDHIIENDFIESVLESIGCHHIQDKGEYISAANPDGDNITAINVYKDNLYTVDYTRDIAKKRDSSDIFNLVEFFQQCNFFEAVKFVCDVIGISVYHDFMGEAPESLQLTQTLVSMIMSEEDVEDEKPLKPIPEHVLTYYDVCTNQMFYEDGISFDVQREMELGYDALTRRITIPIRDVYGNLVGIKGRLFAREVPDKVNKYVYLEPCNRSQILYGLYRAIPYINRKKCCYVVESEKGVLQGMSMGFDNIVATGGKKISKYQYEMLSRLCSNIVLCFDKDVEREELEDIAENFIGSIKVSAIIDTLGILDKKESPTDKEEKFLMLLDKCIVVLRTEESVTDEL